MTDAKVREVHPGVFLVHLPLPMRPTIVNVYLLRSGDEWALIDTGVNTEESIAAFQAALQQVGCTPERIRKIICTHHHPDHLGASKAYKQLTGAELYLHRREYESSLHLKPGSRSEEAIRFFLQHGIPLHRFAHVPSPGDFWERLYVPDVPDHFIDDGDRIAVGAWDIEVITTPGHTPGHCLFYLRAPQVLIVGDHLLPKITPHVGLYPGGPPNPLGDFLDSQRKVQQFEVQLVLPAHGGTFSDHRHRANQIIQHHEYRLREMLDMLRRGPRAAYDVAAQAFGFNGDSPITVQFPATFETLAHLEFLRLQGSVGRQERDHCVFYAAT